MAATDKFEKATLLAFYYVIKYGAPYDPLDEDTYKTIQKNPKKHKPKDVKEEMVVSMLAEYPTMDYTKWYLGIVRGAAALNKKLGNTEGKKDNSYSYGHFGSGQGLSKVAEISSNNDDTDILDYVWNHFSPKMKDEFKGKKDSWDTADVYMIKSNKENEIKSGMDKALCIGENHNKTLEDVGWCLGVGEVNTYMSVLLQQYKLLPLSLKQYTPNTNIKITPTNMSQDPDGVEGLTGKLETPLRNVMMIIREDSKHGKNVPAFDANSLTFTGSFEQGEIGFRYKYESKISSNENHATEPRDMVMNNSNKYVQASARNGAIPAPEMAKLVLEYTGEKINHMIPMNRKLNTGEISYWSSFLESLKGSNGVQIDFGSQPFSVEGETKSRSEFIQIASILDGGKPFSGGEVKTNGGKERRTANFDCEFRSKLRLLRYMKMIMNAKNDKRLGELLATIYFLSSKINFKQGQLSGPFWKIQ